MILLSKFVCWPSSDKTKHTHTHLDQFDFEKQNKKRSLKVNAYICVCFASTPSLLDGKHHQTSQHYTYTTSVVEMLGDVEDSSRISLFGSRYGWFFEWGFHEVGFGGEEVVKALYVNGGCLFIYGRIRQPCSTILRPSSALLHHLTSREPTLSWMCINSTLVIHATTF